MRISILLCLMIYTILSCDSADLESRNEVSFAKCSTKNILKSEPFKQDIQKYKLFIRNEVVFQNLNPFWKSTGLW
ncbi:hypothetical protein AVEN_33015-1 [Araneus ventricosus]|uniref:Lipoprotein n=1 Tax=Araneus ventricosus TaxID=182803 RepID=A0A4Y2NA45_ARAVE|nr:hypothetical protein AVEN_33015-1 [Araneus ventricosus]